MDENNCMVEIARFFLSFTQSESCGKCAPCRLGTTQMLEILTRITQGQGQARGHRHDQGTGRQYHEMPPSAVWARPAPKPALSTLQVFRSRSTRTTSWSTVAPAPPAIPWSSPPASTPARRVLTCPITWRPLPAGRYEQAVEIIRERNPFPAVCGRICIHPCEFKCRRGELDEPVAIRALKRFAADWYFDHMLQEKRALSRRPGSKRWPWWAQGLRD